MALGKTHVANKNNKQGDAETFVLEISAFRKRCRGGAFFARRICRNMIFLIFAAISLADS